MVPWEAAAVSLGRQLCREAIRGSLPVTPAEEPSPARPGPAPRALEERED